MTNNWTREHPEPPSPGSESDWYWYKRDDEKQLLVAEVWPERGWFPDGWWGSIIPKPPSPKESKKNESKENQDTETKSKQKKTKDDAAHAAPNGTVKKRRQRKSKKATG